MQKENITVNHAETNQSPYVKLSLESEDFSKMNMMFNNNQQIANQVQKLQSLPTSDINYTKKEEVEYNQIKPVERRQPQMEERSERNDEIEELSNRTKNTLNGMRVKEKRVEIVTKITYTYEDGSTREVVQTQKHSFK